MFSQELKSQILKLSPSDRLALISVIVESLQDTPARQPDRSGAIQRMRGLLKIDQPTPTDEEVETMMKERRVENYLQ